jgi:DNA-binding NtrC family response regulator
MPDYPVDLGNKSTAARPEKPRVRPIAFHRVLRTVKRVSGRLSRLLLFRGNEAPPRLLVVDDEQAICFSMAEYFSHHGFEVDTASEVEQAERLIASSSYQVLIQDLRLGTDKTALGLEIIRFTRKHSPDTKIVVLTAYGTLEIEAEAKRSGALAFLRKPQPLSQVAQVVSGLLESPRQLSDMF